MAWLLVQYKQALNIKLFQWVAYQHPRSGTAASMQGWYHTAVLLALELLVFRKNSMLL